MDGWIDGLVVALVKSIVKVLSIGLGVTLCDQIWRIAPPLAILIEGSLRIGQILEPILSVLMLLSKFFISVLPKWPTVENAI